MTLCHQPEGLACCDTPPALSCCFYHYGSQAATQQRLLHSVGEVGQVCALRVAGVQRVVRRCPCLTYERHLHSMVQTCLRETQLGAWAQHRPTKAAAISK
jgi:hypothetical protein